MRLIRSGSILFLVMLAVAVLSACDGTQNQDGPLPSIEDVRPIARDPQPDEQAFGNINFVAEVVRFEVARPVPLTHAWSLVDEDVGSPAIRHAWHQNGLRIGLLPSNDYQSFVDAMPEAIESRRSLIISRHDRPYPVHESPPIKLPIRVELTIPPLLPRHEVMRRGRVRLLVRWRGDEGGPAVDVIPHQHYQTPSILPRTPEEIELDGRIFEELACYLPLSGEQLIVVGLWDPTLKPIVLPEETIDDRESGEADPSLNDGDADVEDIESPDGNDESPVERERPTISRSIGTQSLTGRRVGLPVQVVLVFSVKRPTALTPAQSN